MENNYKWIIIVLIIIIFGLNFEVIGQNSYTIEKIHKLTELKINSVETIAWSNNSKYLVIGVNETNRNSNIIIWNVGKKEIVKEIEIVGNINSISWSPDNKFVLLASKEEVSIYKINKWSKLEKANHLEGYLSSWSPDGNYLALGTDKLNIWNTNNWELINELEQVSGPLRTIDWSPDGKFISYSGIDQTTLHLWNFKTKEYELALGSPNTVASVEWSADGDYLALYDSIVPMHGTVYIYETSQWGKPIWELTGMPGSVRYSDNFGLAWSPNSRYLAISGRGETYLWDNQENKFIESIEDITEPIDWSPDGHYIAGTTNNLVIWEINK